MLIPLHLLTSMTKSFSQCFSGHETTAGALTWALYAATLYPEMQSRLRKEISHHALPESPSYAEIEGLSFLNNFTKEVLRFYPPGESNSSFVR